MKNLSLLPAFSRAVPVFFVVFGAAALASTLTACSAGQSLSPESGKLFLASGSIILSHQVPARPIVPLQTAMTHSAEELQKLDRAQSVEKPRLMAPLIGYFPPATAGYVPAQNETWMQIDGGAHKLALFRGKDLIREIQAEGSVQIASGDYFLQHKQKNPVWYAPDSYFAKRLLNVPAAGDRLRYRRGALGDFALYPTTAFPIHCAALWTEEVGGLRVSPEDLASLFLELPVGAPIVVK